MWWPFNKKPKQLATAAPFQKPVMANRANLMSLRPVPPSASDEELEDTDLMIIIDCSKSMNEPSHRFKGKTRYEEVQGDAIETAKMMEKYDSDGLSVISFSNEATMVDGVTADKVSDVFKYRQPSGGTYLNNAILKVVEKAKHSQKKVLALVYTDGEASDRDEVYQTINEAGKKFGRPRIGFTFVQIGTDPGATRFLAHLNDELTVDVVAVVLAEEAESLGPKQLIHKGQHD